MRRVLAILAQPRHYPWITLVLAALVLLPRLGSYGFWEPREISVADAASKWLEQRQAGPTPTAAGLQPEVEDAPVVTEPRKNRMVGSESGGPGAEPGVPEVPTPTPATVKPRRAPGTGTVSAPTQPRLTTRLVAYGVEQRGFSELGARWPLAVLGLLAVMVAYLLGARMASPRAGLLSALILLSFPLLVLQSRQLTSDIASVTGSALVFLGLTGVAQPERWRTLLTPGAGRRAWIPGLLVAGDGVAFAVGAVLVAASGGMLFGLVPPLAGFGLGIILWGLRHRTEAHAEAGVGTPTATPAGRGGTPRGIDPRPRAVPMLVGGIALASALGAAAWFVHQTFSIVAAEEEQRQLFGLTLQPAREALAGLGAPWKSDGDTQVAFSALFEQIGFGLFPWIALAPLVVGRLTMSRAGRDLALSSARAPWAGHVLFCWAALAWIVTTIVTRKVTPVLYPALVAVAVAIGLWLDGFLARREAHRVVAADHGIELRPEVDREGLSLPLVALFAFFAALVVGKDLMSFPDELTSLTSAGAAVKYPEGVRLHLVHVVVAALFGLCLAAGLALWRAPDQGRPTSRPGMLVHGAGRWGLHAAVVIGVLFALFLAQVWVPGLATKMSSRDVLGRYRELRREGDQLGILGNLGSGPSYYAGGQHQKLTTRAELIEFLKRPGRVFALTRASELCPLHKESNKSRFSLHVLDDANAQFLLLSNKLLAGELDQNPLRHAVKRTLPSNIGKPLSVNFDDQIELIGVDMPRKVRRRDRFQMTLYYKVLKPVTRPWKIFVHIDAPGARIPDADHSPIRGRCSMSYFQVGDYIVDQFEIKAGDMTFPKTTYKVWTGFFVGSGGNFTNMKALGGNPDQDSRVPIGSIQVE